uniref:Glycosyltransferase 6 n=1 Tax=Setaria italica TaxID=4555 RepID=K3ZIJ5_SETIT
MAARSCCASSSARKKQKPSPRRARDALVFAAGVAAAVLALLGPASVLAPGRGHLIASPVIPGPEDGPRTFYDDPELSYDAVDGRRMTGWDAKRAAWLRSRGLGGRRRSAPERVVMVSGSQPEPCAGDAGDDLMLRFLKNKLDYCRLHGIELLYNRDFLQPAMTYAWAKLPIVRAAMLAHPEAEWVWWVDSDAAFTDMDFYPPARHQRFFGKRSWLGLNTGVFLIRNCQWSLDLMDEWARMGPAYPEHERWGKVIMESLTEKGSPWSCDQSALVYLLLNNWERLGKKAYIETEYYLHGYWVDIMDRLDGVAERYEAVERSTPGLRRRHAEREHARYAAARNAAVGAAVPGPAGGGKWGWRRPFVTHFVGCQPCGGWRNPMYSKESCEGGMRRALGFADDQVLRAYGFRHAAPLNDTVQPLPFDYPAAHARSN